MSVGAYCPFCHGPLAGDGRHGARVLRCDECSGGWVGDGELDGVAQAVWRAGAERRRLRGRWLIGRWAH